MTVLQKISAGLGLVALLLGVYLLFAQDDSMGIMVIALGLVAIVLPRITARTSNRNDSDAR